MKALSILVVFVVLSVLFQNCSPQATFDTVSETSSSSESDAIQITSYPWDQSVAYGSTVSLSVDAVSNLNRKLSFQWFKNGTSISGATSKNLSIYSASTNDSGYYSAVISDGENLVETRAVSVTVQAAQAGVISFSKNPTSATVTEGSTIYLSSTAYDSLASQIAYQWYFNGNAIANATSSELYISNAVEANEGYYYVSATSSSGTQKSSTVYVTVNVYQRTCTYGSLYNGHCYFPSTGVATYSGAQASCASLGGYLAKITDANENYFIYSISGGGLYIGLSDEAKEGTWVWRDGSAVSYTIWAAGEPNNSNNEDCAVMRNDGAWNDGTCTTYGRFACEFD